MPQGGHGSMGKSAARRGCGVAPGLLSQDGTMGQEGFTLTLHLDVAAVAAD